MYIRSVFDNMSMNYFINLLTNVIANTIVFITDICSIYKLGFIGWTVVDRLMVIFITEIFVVILEIILYYLYFGKKNLFKISLLTIIANALSYFLGNYILKLI